MGYQRRVHGASERTQQAAKYAEMSSAAAGVAGQQAMIRAMHLLATNGATGAHSIALSASASSAASQLEPDFDRADGTRLWRLLDAGGKFWSVAQFQEQKRQSRLCSGESLAEACTETGFSFR